MKGWTLFAHAHDELGVERVEAPKKPDWALPKPYGSHAYPNSSRPVG